MNYDASWIQLINAALSCEMGWKLALKSSQLYFDWNLIFFDNQISLADSRFHENNRYINNPSLDFGNVLNILQYTYTEGRIDLSLPVYISAIRY